MTRYGLVSRTYPSGYWERNGDEIRALADEINDGRWSMREAMSLFHTGLRTRARLAVGGTTQGVWRDAARWVVVLVLALQAAQVLSWASENRPLDTGGSVTILLALGALLVVTQNTGRAAAMLVTLQLVVFGMTNDPTGSGYWELIWLLWLPFVCYSALMWWVALTGDKKGAMAWWQALGICGLFYWAFDRGEAVLWGLAVAAVVALLASIWDPRFAATVAVTGAVWFMASAPIAFGNPDTGWLRWGPILINSALVVLPMAAVWLSTRRVLRT